MFARKQALPNDLNRNENSVKNKAKTPNMYCYKMSSELNTIIINGLFKRAVLLPYARQGQRFEAV